MTAKRDQQRNAAERFLVGMLRSSDDELVALARSRFGADTKVDVEHLKRVKAIVEALLSTFTSTTDVDARRSERALAALKDATPEPAPVVHAPPRQAVAPREQPPPVVTPPVVPRARDAESRDRSPWAVGTGRGAAPSQPMPAHPPPVAFLEPNASFGRTVGGGHGAGPPHAAPLPFKASSEASSPAPGQSALEPHAQMGATAALDSSRTPAPALPFNAPKGAAAATPEALDSYARFCAECALEPEALHRVRARWGLADELAHMRMDDRWRKHFVVAPEARQTWERLVAHYRAALSGH